LKRGCTPGAMVPTPPKTFYNWLTQQQRKKTNVEHLNKHEMNKLLVEVFCLLFFKKVGRRRHYLVVDLDRFNY
jgi:hypothetical protein